MRSDVIVLGGGPVGLATAMLLARDGREVTILEKDPQSPPATADEAWERWERRGVGQFHQAHGMHPKFRHVLDAELPDVRDELIDSGARVWNPLSSLPLMDRSPRDGDDRFTAITARRPILESAMARVAEDTAGVKVLRGVAAEGPIAGTSLVDGVPHVVGVRTNDGAEMTADLIVDAMGRRSRFCDWVTSLHGRPPYEEASDVGFAYYTRHYRSADGTLPEFRGMPISLIGSILLLTLHGDNGTTMVAFAVMAGDRPLKALRNNDSFERVVRSIPHAAHWVDSEPLHDVIAMAGVLDRYRRFVIDDEPVVTGMVAVGDASQCTNPTAGRGMSVGLMHATLLRDSMRDTGDDPVALAIDFDAATEEQITPWYRQQVEADEQRASDFRAVIDGRDLPASSDPGAQMRTAFLMAAMSDPDVLRALFETTGCLALPHEVMARPEIAKKVEACVGLEPPQPRGPSRAELVALLS